jgi:hypothetical protein
MTTITTKSAIAVRSPLANLTRQHPGKSGLAVDVLLALTRVSIGWIFLWAFLDKLESGVLSAGIGLHEWLAAVVGARDRPTRSNSRHDVGYPTDRHRAAGPGAGAVRSARAGPLAVASHRRGQ